LYLITTIPDPPVLPLLCPPGKFCVPPAPPPVLAVPAVPDAGPGPEDPPPIPPPPGPAAPPVPVVVKYPPPPPPPPAYVTADPEIKFDKPAPPAPPVPGGAGLGNATGVGPFNPRELAPPPPPPPVGPFEDPTPPGLPCGGLTGGVFPAPPKAYPLGPAAPPPPPPEPPVDPDVPPAPPPVPLAPPPALVIVENIELEPLVP